MEGKSLPSLLFENNPSPKRRRGASATEGSQDTNISHSQTRQHQSQCSDPRNTKPDSIVSSFEFKNGHGNPDIEEPESATLLETETAPSKFSENSNHDHAGSYTDMTPTNTKLCGDGEGADQYDAEEHVQEFNTTCQTFSEVLDQIANNSKMTTLRFSPSLGDSEVYEQQLLQAIGNLHEHSESLVQSFHDQKEQLHHRLSLISNSLKSES